MGAAATDREEHDGRVGDVQTFAVGAARLTRVPYFDVDLPCEAVSLTEDEIAAVPWAEPVWCAGPAQVRVGQVFWVIESERDTIVVDPCCASDPFLRSGTEAVAHQDAAFAAFAAAGFDPAAVDVVVMSHLDGIGMNALTDGDGGWSPAFPNAPIVLSTQEWERVETRDGVAGVEALRALHAAGAADPVDLPYRITNEVRLVASGGHTAGHATVEVESRGERAVLIGHLAVNPVHAGVTAAATLHDDPDLGVAALRAALLDAANDDALVIGPLWPTPGAARVGSLDPVVLVPQQPA